MLSDIKLLEAVKKFLDDNLDTKKVASTYLHAPDPNATTPYCLVVFNGSNFEITETEGSGEETIDIQLTVFTEKYGYGTEEERKSLFQL